MRLLDRYLLRELLVPLGYCMVGILLFWISADIITEMEEFQEHGVTPTEVVEYYLVKLPEFLTTLLPIALLLALLYSLTHHARHHELIAIRCAGVGLWRLCLPYIGVGLLLSLGLFAVNEFWLPRSVELAHQIQEGWEEADEEFVYENLNFHNARDDRFWNIQKYDPLRQSMTHADIEWRLPDGSKRHWIAEQAFWTNGVWRLKDVEGFFYPAESDDPKGTSPDPEKGLPKPIQAEELSLPRFPETPDYIELQVRINEVDSLRDKRKVHLSIQEILKFRRLNPDLDPEMASLLNTKLQMRLATPITCLVVVLISLPFGIASSRRDAFVGVASSIFICIGYILVQRLAFSMGVGEYLSPWVAAWTPNFVFGGFGVGMMARVR